MISEMSSVLHLLLLFLSLEAPFGCFKALVWTLWASSRSLMDPLGLLQAPGGPVQAPPGALSEIGGTADFRDRFAALLFWSAPPLQGRGGDATRALFLKA